MRKLLATAVAVIALASMAEAAVLDRVAQTGTLTLGYRTDATPFAYKSSIGEPAGYSVELCRAVADEVKTTLKLGKLDVKYVEVGGTDRFDAIKSGKIDLLCGATTVTLGRREMVDFSLPTFATGSTLLYRKDGPQDFVGLKGQKVGARAGSTTQPLLEKAFAANKIDAEIVPITDHADGVARLASGELGAYFGDGAILLFHWLQSPDREKLKLSDVMLSNEPYALALPKGDDAFRLVVDRALARLYRGGGIDAVFSASFGTKAKPSGLVQSLYLLNSLAE